MFIWINKFRRFICLELIQILDRSFERMSEIQYLSTVCIVLFEVVMAVQDATIYRANGIQSKRYFAKPIYQFTSQKCFGIVTIIDYSNED